MAKRYPWIILGVSVFFSLGCGYTVLPWNTTRTSTSPKLVEDQDSFWINVHKHIQEAEREKELRTPEENRLHGLLYPILKLAEEADTSVEKRSKLARILRLDHLRLDTLGRIRVEVELNGMSAVDPVVNDIRLLGMIVEDKLRYFPVLYCRVYPKDLRKLISISGILSIRDTVPGFTR